MAARNTERANIKLRLGLDNSQRAIDSTPIAVTDQHPPSLSSSFNHQLNPSSVHSARISPMYDIVVPWFVISVSEANSLFFLMLSLLLFSISGQPFVDAMLTFVFHIQYMDVLALLLFFLLSNSDACLNWCILLFYVFFPLQINNIKCVHADTNSMSS